MDKSGVILKIVSRYFVSLLITPHAFSRCMPVDQKFPKRVFPNPIPANFFRNLTDRTISSRQSKKFLRLLIQQLAGAALGVDAVSGNMRGCDHGALQQLKINIRPVFPDIQTQL